MGFVNENVMEKKNSNNSVICQIDNSLLFLQKFIEKKRDGNDDIWNHLVQKTPEELTALWISTCVSTLD